MLSPRAPVSNPTEKSYSQDVLSVKPMVMPALEPHKHHEQILLWGELGSNRSKPHTEQTPQSHSWQSQSLLSFQTPRRRPRHTSMPWALSQAGRNPPAQPFFQTGASCTRQQSSANCSQKTQQTKINTRCHQHNLTELKAELGRCCLRASPQSVIALPPPLERSC